MVLMAALSGAALAAVPDDDGLHVRLFTGEPSHEMTAPAQPARETLARGEYFPLESILKTIERRYPGHQLSVSGPSKGGNGYVYRIKWLTEGGAVLYIIADAESGAILSVDGG